MRSVTVQLIALAGQILSLLAGGTLVSMGTGSWGAVWPCILSGPLLVLVGVAAWAMGYAYQYEKPSARKCGVLLLGQLLVMFMQLSLLQYVERH